ncbi:CRISPR-associated endoribonuclease Cas6 [Clostridium saccharobutylicum]|uniref:CRISPR-associated protein Cas6 n=1 Tax=Clostridium saccharobutylicum DSM 13864 TaxID=1345695 RepID=U5MSI8_CLOSA|nr:CRISPR-associated endoribonuclease Cas6 [Clostridium saccharobutylicum]AGX43473.1 CRISPR-associated protein Cas6 [Clostridium saccharobutylicum DSM 13864]AQR90772.1 CRISPR associated protein Cas6 [Clostridium saccharobutylicum]AQS00676.1 CRISPR associated protein Cas6 [Clostridium saccharobutylicum]AQS14659.1 CRISPR associated protein Cas6 [Clostridium saccharobutylicum]MBA2906425.1 CRISPR-associated endoribonuclease Cas6 [Clostridium saccharobutylicum]
MNVFQIKLKIFVLKDIPIEDSQGTVSAFIDSGLIKDEKLLEFHESNKFKGYCFDAPYPLEDDKIYKKDKIYTITIRTIDKNLAEFFANKLVNEFNENVKGLTSEIRILPKKHIEKLYSITPAVMKNEDGYWKNKIKLDDFERRLKENLIKKYNSTMNLKIDEDFQLYTSIEFKNKKPISTKYKNIKLLGDKISLNIAENENAQKLAYMSLGTGIFEMNARGYGYVNYRWL